MAFSFAWRSEAPLGEREGTEAPMARRETEDPAGTQRLMEEVCERENRREALQRVRANQGSPGIEGMTVDELPEYLEQHWPAIREQLLSGTYKPKPVLRVEIDKPDGGVRKLGIPTVVDRLVQQMVQQRDAKAERAYAKQSAGASPEEAGSVAIRIADQVRESDGVDPKKPPKAAR